MLSRSFGKKIDYEQLLNPSVLYNLEKVRLEANKVDEGYFYDVLCDNDVVKDAETAEYLTYVFISWLLNKKANLDYLKFLGSSEFINPAVLAELDLDYDGAVYGDLHRNRVYHIDLPFLDTFIKTSIYTHEFAHYMNCKRVPKLSDNVFYIEIIPILNQHLFTEFCRDKDFFKECGDLNYLYHYDNIIRFLRMSDESFLNYEDGKDMVSVFYKNLLYYYGYIYANKLFEGYLDDKNKFLKKFRALYNGAKLEDFLKYYGADLRYESAIEPTMKILKKYQ